MHLLSVTLVLKPCVVFSYVKHLGLSKFGLVFVLNGYIINLPSVSCHFCSVGLRNVTLKRGFGLEVYLTGRGPF